LVLPESQFGFSSCVHSPSLAAAVADDAIPPCALRPQATGMFNAIRAELEKDLGIRK
jgi:hypothetical protein